MLLLKMILTQKRPVGVTLLALVYLWIGGFGTVFFPIIFLFWVLTGALPMLSRQIAGGMIHSEILLKITSYTLLSVWYLLYLAYLAIGIGLWKLKNWARKASIAINLFAAAISVAALPFFVRPALLAVACVAWTFVPFSGIAWYLYRPRVRFAFGAWLPQGDRSAADLPPGLSRAGKVIVVATLAGTIVLFFFGVSTTVEDAFRKSDVYRMALREAQESPCALKMLGTPISPEGSVNGDMSEGGQTGFANLSIAVSGPKGKGSVAVRAKKESGVWTIKSLDLVRGSERLQIEPPDPTAVCQ